MKKYFVFIQARLGSTRLPGKALLTLPNGQTVLSRIISNIQKVESLIPVVLTSDLDLDFPIVDYCSMHDIKFFKGSHENVRKRFLDAFDQFGLEGNEYCFRVCADNPLIFSQSFNILINKLNSLNNHLDYISFGVQNKPSILSHCGLFPEMFRVDSLKTFSKFSNNEHITTQFYRDPLFEIYLEPTRISKDLRLTIDDLVDYVEVYKIIANNSENFEGEIFNDSENFKSEQMKLQIKKHNK